VTYFCAIEEINPHNITTVYPNSGLYANILRMQSPITKHTLDNGLQVVLKEIHFAPLISHWVWYRVGSRDEISGSTGISHWVEHMQFKGTPKYPSQVLDKAISRVGGIWNAFTHLDWTTYFETLPAHEIGLALDLEADRMTSSLFDPHEVESERTVIISERQGNENQPLFRLTEEVQAAAFRVHPYHHMVIGDMADLHTIQRDDLYSHYNSYYSPSNAVVAITGDFDSDVMLDRVNESYGSIPGKQVPPRVNRPEPSQTGERRVDVEGPGETTFLQLAFHIPAANHLDFLPLMVLDSLLTGPSNLNMFGTGISNKTSLLYQSLVEKELAVSVFGGMQAAHDPFLYTINVILHPESNVENVLAAIDDQIQLIQESIPALSSLERAAKQARALFAYGSESITNTAFWLGISEMVATYEWFVHFLDKLGAVCPEDVQRAASTYLRPQNRVSGVYLPTGNGRSAAQ